METTIILIVIVIIVGALSSRQSRQYESDQWTVSNRTINRYRKGYDRQRSK